VRGRGLASDLRGNLLLKYAVPEGEKETEKRGAKNDEDRTGRKKI